MFGKVPSRELLYREFGILLATERRRKRLSQAQLAQLAGLSRTSITNIERGRQPVQLHQIYFFASMLRVDVQNLLPKESALVPEPSSAVETNTVRYLAEAMKLLKASKPPAGGTHG